MCGGSDDDPSSDVALPQICLCEMLPSSSSSSSDLSEPTTTTTLVVVKTFIPSATVDENARQDF